MCVFRKKKFFLGKRKIYVCAWLNTAHSGSLYWAGRNNEMTSSILSFNSFVNVRCNPTFRILLPTTRVLHIDFAVYEKYFSPKEKMLKTII